MYKKTIDFDKIDFLPFYFAKFVSSNNPFVVFFRSSKYKIKSSENKNNVSSSFPNWIPFILFPHTYFFWLKFQVICWVTVVTCLNLEEMHWFFPIWYDASCGFVALTIIILSYYVENSLFNILSWQHIEIYERFFCMYQVDNVNFTLDTIYMLYSIYWFVYVELPSNPLDESNLIWVYDLLNVLLKSIWMYFTIYLHQVYCGIVLVLFLSVEWHVIWTLNADMSMLTYQLYLMSHTGEGCWL
jgi:hypothetical protein